MRKFRIPYIPYRSLLLSTTVLNDKHRRPGIGLVVSYDLAIMHLSIHVHDRTGTFASLL